MCYLFVSLVSHTVLCFVHGIIKDWGYIFLSRKFQPDWLRYVLDMGKARDFKNHVTPAVFSFVVTSTFV